MNKRYDVVLNPQSIDSLIMDETEFESKVDTTGNPFFMGQCFGVRLYPHMEDIKSAVAMVGVVVGGGSTVFQLLSFHSHWIDDLIPQLQEARQYMNDNYTKTSFGWRAHKP